MVVRLAIRLPVALEEVAGAQLLGAVGTGEVLGVPSLAEGGDDLAHDGLLASAAAALLARVHSLATHVGLQVAEHRIQILLGGGRVALRDVRGFLGERVVGDRGVLMPARVHLQAEEDARGSAAR